MRLNCNWWTLFGISNNNEYLRLTLFGIRISIKMNKEKVDNLAWFIPVKKGERISEINSLITL
ncbi:hypothetical protein [Brachyspira aalborgi]|uniref:hypothetical protein n=1 Tax=Brachyspira aalborgi TaxID=29522 RepID=UPI001F54AD16|nr:hypothetical protein [Brachyspira aalborgi]